MPAQKKKASSAWKKLHVRAPINTAKQTPPTHQRASTSLASLTPPRFPFGSLIGLYPSLLRCRDFVRLGRRFQHPPQNVIPRLIVLFGHLVAQFHPPLIQ